MQLNVFSALVTAILTSQVTSFASNLARAVSPGSSHVSPQQGRLFCRRRHQLVSSKHIEIVTQETQTETISHLRSVMMSSIGLPPWGMVSDVLERVPIVGGNVVAATTVVAIAQATVALLQYRTNPSGQLIAPPGRTIGVALPSKPTASTVSGSLDVDPVSNQLLDTQVATNTSNITTSKAVAVHSFRQTQLDHQDHNPIRLARVLGKGSVSTATSQYAKLLHRVNRWLVLLIPWATQQFGYLVQRSTHLFHLGLIMTLAGLFDVPNRWLYNHIQHQQDPIQPTSHQAQQQQSDHDAVEDSKPVERIVVIGDSLAVGLGGVNVFDAEKNGSLPFYRIENVGNLQEGGNNQRDRQNLPGPVFPRALAQSLADRGQVPVHWRSAGVDGGDTQNIQDHCLGLIQEEVDQGRSPDVVVVLCGMNDLKYFVSNPLTSPGPRAFRARLYELIDAIHDVAGPQTKVVLPMFPTQMFHRNSPLNIFPLNIFLDATVGLWELQKKSVADRHPSHHVLYVGLRPAELSHWYDPEILQKPGDENSSGKNHRNDTEGRLQKVDLISADGIHPNAKCYARWAECLCDRLLPAGQATDRAMPRNSWDKADHNSP